MTAQGCRDTADHDTMRGAKPSLTFLEFFAGAGLVRLGLEPTWSCAWANDIDPRKQAVYEARFGTSQFVLRDIGQVSVSALPEGTDMAWASFPCQDLSLAGERRGLRAERSGTFWEFWRLMRTALERADRPPLIVIENVVGLLYGPNFPLLCEALAALNMQFGPLIMDARRFLPQSRPRVFMVALDARVDCSAFTHAVFPANSPWCTKAVRTAYAQATPSLQAGWRWWKLPTPAVPVPRIDHLMETKPTGVAWHSPEETDRLLRMMTEANLAKIQQALQQGLSVGFLYKRTRGGRQRAEVRFDGIAGCLRTPQGGSSRQIVLVLDQGTIRSRLLSPREAARLMEVTDSFWLSPRYNDAYRAMEDGVAVPVVQWLSDQLLSPLANLCRNSRQGIRDERGMSRKPQPSFRPTAGSGERVATRREVAL